MKDLEFMYDDKDGVKTAKSYETFADFVNAVETNEADCPALNCKNVQATIFGSNLITPRFNTVGDLYQFGKSVVTSKEREREKLLSEILLFRSQSLYGNHNNRLNSDQPALPHLEKIRIPRT